MRFRKQIYLYIEKEIRPIIEFSPSIRPEVSPTRKKFCATKEKLLTVIDLGGFMSYLGIHLDR